MKNPSILFALLLAATGLNAQNQTIAVWDSTAIPLSKHSPNYQPEVLRGDGKVRIRQVTHPQIEVFLPETGHPVAGVLILPGGGYERLAIDHEGWDVARMLNQHQIAAFVLRYRLPSPQIMKNPTWGPLMDARQAMRIIRQQASRWNLAPDCIGVMGFSAGGHLASSLSTISLNSPIDGETDTTRSRPDFSILIYPVITMQDAHTHKGSRRNLLGEAPATTLIDDFSCELRVSPDTPPAFLVHSGDDTAVPVQNSMRYYEKLQQHGIPAELHLFPTGGHGYGMAPGLPQGIWTNLLIHWLHQNILPPHHP